MLPVFICEDEERIREAEREYIEKQILIEGYDMKTAVCTGSPEELLEALSGEQRGIYFLDVELKGASMDGFELGQQIRKKDARGFLIYVTAFQDLAFETFRYHLEALDYICKQDQTKMFADISRCLKAVTERMQQEKGQKQPYFTVKVLDVVRHIPVEEILYFSTAGRTHRVELHTKRERLDFIGSMQELERTLGPGFCRVHRACLVNTDQITGVDRKQKELLLKKWRTVCIFPNDEEKDSGAGVRSGSEMNRSGILQPEQPRKWYDKRRILQYPGGMDQMSETNIKRKQLFIFLLVAYGVTYLMGILMWYGSTASLGLSAFPNAQMMYPAAGVMLAYALTERGERKLTRWFYGIFLLMTVLMAVLAVLSVLAPESIIQLPGGEFTLWALVQQFVLIGGSLLCWIALLLDGKGRRKACGLGWRNWKPSLFCILLFLLLYFGRAGISYALTGQAGFLVETLTRPEAWSYLLFMPVNFILAFAAFFGEEYGWRYYLQPILQERFGVRTGVLILGVVWGLWHLPCDFFYYVTPDKGLIMTTSQIITCVTLGIFFAFAYMKTENIWVPVILHYMNNNLAPVIANTYSADVLENQEVTWGMVPASLVMNGLLFGFFLLAKEFRGRKVPE